MNIVINCDSASIITIRENKTKGYNILREREDCLEIKEYNMFKLFNRIWKKMWIKEKFIFVPQEREQVSVNRKLNLEYCNIYWIVKRLFRKIYKGSTQKIIKSENVNLKKNKKIVCEMDTDRDLNDGKGEKNNMKERVFIVHGHDQLLKSEVARLIEKLGFEAVILHEQADGSDTIIEKLEEYSDVAFAVILYTGCDLGTTEDNKIVRNRPRPNVIFEHGYFNGKLGRKRVNVLVKGDVERPGDISGIVYTEIDEEGAWKTKLVKNMKKAGLNVDANLLL